MIKQAKMLTGSNTPQFSVVKEQTSLGLLTRISSDLGSISVITGSKWSPAKHSISEFVVDEHHRGVGNGDKLLREAIRLFPHDIGGQCSSKSSTALMHKHGFRMFNNPHSTLQEALDRMDEDTSVYMRLV